MNCVAGVNGHVGAGNRYVCQVDIALTEEGQERWEEVAALVHAHARLVRELPAENARRAWEEARDMSAIYLRFQQARLLTAKNTWIIYIFFSATPSIFVVPLLNRQRDVSLRAWNCHGHYE